MAESIGLKTEVHQVIWTTEKTGLYQGRSSPKFTLLNIQYSLYLSLYTDQVYYLYIRNAKDQRVSYLPWHTTVGIAQGTDSCLIERSVALQDRGYRDSIWQKSVSDVMEAVPDFYSTSFLSFRISFQVDSAVCTVRSKILKDISVQTSSYLDPRSNFETLSLDFAKLLDGDSHHDVEIKCGDRVFKAHRIVLSARSEVFSAMLQSNMVEGKTGQVNIPYMDAELFRLFLEYLYTGKLPELSVDVARQLYEVGDKYALEELKNNCSDFLRDSLKRESFCDILVLADLHTDQDLKEAVIAYIMNEKLPLSDDLWPEFCNNHPKIAIEVLNRFYKSRCSTQPD